MFLCKDSHFFQWLLTFYLFCATFSLRFLYLCNCKVTVKRYNDYGNWLRGRFPFRVQKVMLDAGFTCPNRDGSKGVGGCVFCDNQAFNPSFCDREKSIRQQLADGKAFFGRKYPDMKYLAYFQAFSNTYADVETLRRRYEEALAVEDVVGIVVGTRPDCVNEAVLDYLERLSRQVFVMVEYGVESVNDHTLRTIHREHDFACSRKAIEMTAERGVLTGGHVILGLPGEDAKENLRQAAVVGSLPLHVLKIHHLQVLRGTRLAKMYEKEPFPVYSVDSYVALLAEYISRLPARLLLERFVNVSPPKMVVAPGWGVKGSEFLRRLEDYMVSHGLWQGKLAGVSWEGAFSSPGRK